MDNPFDNSLPLNLISFVAVESHMNVELRWVTTNEEGHDRFEIERSVDQLSWRFVGSVMASSAEENDKGENHYTFIDHGRPEGAHYYRLQQIDLDGSQTSSEIIHVGTTNQVCMFIPTQCRVKLIFSLRQILTFL